MHGECPLLWMGLHGPFLGARAPSPLSMPVRFCSLRLLPCPNQLSGERVAGSCPLAPLPSPTSPLRAPGALRQAGPCCFPRTRPSPLSPPHPPPSLSAKHSQQTQQSPRSSPAAPAHSEPAWLRAASPAVSPQARAAASMQAKAQQPPRTQKPSRCRTQADCRVHLAPS